MNTKKRKSIKNGKSIKAGKPIKNGKSIKARKSIKKGTPKKESDIECPICLEKITNDAIRLHCTHIFHKTCMTGVCNMSQFNAENKCNCPLCRTMLNPDELDILGITYPTQPVLNSPTLQRINDVYREVYYPPRLYDIDQFKQYINDRLAANYSRTPLRVLLDVLEEFNGTNHTPPQLIGNIMEFRLKHSSLFSFSNTYEFTKIVGEGYTFDRRYNKYFEFEFDDEAIVTGIIEH